MYPLKFENLYYEKIWGGREFNEFRNNLPKNKNIGESWDVTCHNNGMSVVTNGEFKGKTLYELIKDKGEDIIGTKISKDKFPLLIKLINAKENLSIQVHPNNEYAKKNNELGKTEVWYVLKAEKNSKLIVGLKNISNKYELKKYIQNRNINKYTNEINVKPGEVYFIRSGMVHAIGKGIMVAEIQQNSDTTYRIYDYGRGRKLNIQEALDVIDLKLEGKKSVGLLCRMSGYNKTYLCLCKEFSLELYDVEKSFEEFSDKERFFCFTVVKGEGEILYKDNNCEKSLKISMGESIFIPALLGKYIINGKLSLLKSYVPNIDNVRKDILKLVEN